MRTEKVLHKILVVDDDKTSRETLQGILSMWGHTVILAEDGEEALSIVTVDHTIQIMIIDRKMPKMDGITLCKKVTELKRQLPVYLILLTVLGNPDNIVEGLEAGAHDYITKPFHPEELMARIEVGTRIIELQSKLYKALKSLRIKNQRLSDLATLDELTGIYNRRTFNYRFEEEWKRSRREGTTLSVAIVDIDHFKNFNDTYGHISGDICLTTVAQVINDCFQRPADFVARYGGEEFVIIMPRTTAPKVMLKKCCQAISDLNMPHQKSEHKKVTISIGGATVEPQQSYLSPYQFLEMADKELYKAKEEGRNRYSLLEIT